MAKAYLVLQNGDVFEGESLGLAGETVGELVFTTGVVGYVETLSDPSYRGQIIMHTFPQIGNYGHIPEDMESPRCHAKGVVVRECCGTPSNFRSAGTVDDFLKEQGVVGISGVDTREITRIIREAGVMNAMITPNLPEGVPKAVSDFRIIDSVSECSVKSPLVVSPEGKAQLEVTLIDYGAKENIIRELLSRGCRVTVMPYDSAAGEILDTDPDGIMLSNGSGNPADNTVCIEEIKKLMGKRPMFGICLGHQLMALANGAKTAKLKYGHRGSNQPVKEMATGKVYITSQNHGYAVQNDSLPGTGAVLSYINVNDGSCEGLIYPDKMAFSLQFHPESHAGPRDMEFAFDAFTEMMRRG